MILCHNSLPSEQPKCSAECARNLNHQKHDNVNVTHQRNGSRHDRILMDYQTQPPKHGSCVRRKEKLLLCKTLLSIDLGFAECTAGRCSAEIHPGNHRPAVFFVFFPPSHTAGAIRRARPVAAVPIFLLAFFLTLAKFWQTLRGPFSAASTPIFASKYSFESS